MAERFVLTAQLRLQAPTNTRQVVDQMRRQLKGVTVDVQAKGAAKTQKEIRKVNTEIQAASKSAKSFGSILQTSFGRVAALAGATRLVSLFTNKLGNAITSAVEFERELIKVSQVTGKTLSELQGLTKEITRLSTSLGVSSNALIGVARQLSQAGFSARDLQIALGTLARTELAATFGDIEQTAEGAIAIFNQFNTSAAALEGQLGAINRVAGSFAVEAGDLIGVVRRVGGVFRSAGGDLNELIALFTSVRSTTRESSESIATGLRTIFTRIQRPSTIRFLRELGVELTDAQGRFVGPLKAVEALSKAFANLPAGDTRFIQIAEELGGFRQIGKVIPLINQFGVAQAALAEATAGQTSLSKDAETAQQALAVQFQKVREEYLALVRSFTQGGIFKILAGTALTFLSTLAKVLDTLNKIGPAIAALGIGALLTRGGGGGLLGGLFGRGATRRNQGGPIGFARGGVVPGTGNRDTVPAMLTPGEFVIKKSSVGKIGTDTLAAMNENRFAQGGLVVQKLDDTKYAGLFAKPKGEDSSGKPLTIVPEKGKQKKNDVLATIGAPKSFFIGNTDEARFTDKADSVLRRGINEVVRTLDIDEKTANRADDNIIADIGVPDIAGKIFEGVTRTAIGDFRQGDGNKQTFDIPKGTGKIAGALETLGSLFNGGKELKDIDYDNKLSESRGNRASLLKKAITKKHLLPDIPLVSFQTKKSNQELLALKGGDDRSRKLAQRRKELLTARGKLPSVLNDPEAAKLIDARLAADLKKVNTAIPQTFRSKNPTLFASGGNVSGQDTVPALLTPGEFVINKKAAGRIGAANLNTMNKKGIVGFNKGGSVGRIQKFVNGGRVEELEEQRAILKRKLQESKDKSAGISRTISSQQTEKANAGELGIGVIGKEQLEKEIQNNIQAFKEQGEITNQLRDSIAELDKEIEAQIKEQSKGVGRQGPAGRQGPLGAVPTASGLERVPVQNQTDAALALRKRELEQKRAEQAVREETLTTKARRATEKREILPSNIINDFIELGQESSETADALKEVNAELARRKEPTSTTPTAANRNVVPPAGPPGGPPDDPGTFRIKKPSDDVISDADRRRTQVDALVREFEVLREEAEGAADSLEDTSKAADKEAARRRKVTPLSDAPGAPAEKFTRDRFVRFGKREVRNAGSRIANSRFPGLDKFTLSGARTLFQDPQAAAEAADEQATAVAQKKDPKAAAVTKNLDKFNRDAEIASRRLQALGIATLGLAAASTFARENLGEWGDVTADSIDAVAGAATSFVALKGLTDSLGPQFQQIGKGVAFAGAAFSLISGAVAAYVNVIDKQTEEAVKELNVSKAIASAKKAEAASALGNVAATTAAGAAIGFFVAGPLGLLIGAIAGLAAALFFLDKSGKQSAKELAALQGVVSGALQETDKVFADFAKAGKDGIDSATAFQRASQKLAIAEQAALAIEDNTERRKALAQVEEANVRLAAEVIAPAANSMDELKEKTKNMSTAAQAAAVSSFQVAAANRALVESTLDAARIQGAVAAASTEVQNVINSFKAGSSQLKASFATLETSITSFGDPGRGESAAGKIGAFIDDFFAERGGTGTTTEKALQRSVASAGAANQFSSQFQEAFNDQAPLQAADQAGQVRERVLKIAENIDDPGLQKVIRGSLDDAIANATDKATGTVDVSKVFDNLTEKTKGLIDPLTKFGQAIIDQQNTINELTKARRATEQKLIDAQKKAIDIQLDAAKVIEEAGGARLTGERKLAARTEQFNLVASDAGVSGLRGGSAQDINRVGNEIFRESVRQQRQVQTGQGIGVDEDRRAELQKANQGLIKFSQQRIKLIQEELKVIKKRNELEKSAIDALLSGDAEAFFEQQGAAAAASAIRSGNTALLRSLDASDVAKGLKSLEGTVSSAELFAGARAAGLSDRQAQILSGTTPEEQALNNQLIDTAGALQQQAAISASLERLNVATAEMVIQQANITFQETLNNEISRQNAIDTGAFQQQAAAAEKLEQGAANLASKLDSIPDKIEIAASSPIKIEVNANGLQGLEGAFGKLVDNQINQALGKLRQDGTGKFDANGGRVLDT